MPYLAYADVPNTISFQGYLSDDSGNAVNGSTDISFSIVDTSWKEKHYDVPVKNGSSQRVQLSSVHYPSHVKGTEQCRICLYYADTHGSSSRRMMCINLKNGADSGFMNFGGDVDSNDILKMTFKCDNGPTGHWNDWSH
jgi:hypothetical protein